MDKKQPISFYTFPDFITQAKKFAESYELLNVVTCLDGKPKLKPRSERVCRFCHGKMPNVRFKKDAHIIPELLGNRYLVSDFECDNCNALFGLNENHLAHFLGLERTLHRNKGKNGVPTFLSHDKQLKACKNEFFDAGFAVKIEKMNVESQALNVNNETAITSLKFTKTPYVPLKVYKALLHIALCVVPENEIGLYENAFRFMLTDELDKLLIGGFDVHVYKSPNVFYKLPVGFLFKKRRVNDKMPFHIFNLYVNDLLIQFHTVFNLSDIQFIKRNIELEIPICPPMGIEPINEEVTLYQRFYDFASTDILIEEEEMHFKMNKDDIANRVAVDMNSGEVIDDAVYDPKKIVALQFTPEGFTLPIKKP